MVTMKDIAQAAGVSTATVSRVLNGVPGMSAATAARVNLVMQELNYRPNHIARSLRTVSTRTLGVLVSNVANPFFAGLVHSIEDSASELGMGLVLGNASEQPDRQLSYLNAFLEKQVDGIIITPTGSESGWAEEILAQQLPLVFVDRTLAGVDVPSVTIDDEAAFRLLIEHFMNEGHRSAAIVTGPSTNMPIRHRIAGFLAAAEPLGFTVRPEHIVAGGVLREDGSRAVRELLGQPGERPDVIFTLNNTMALGALAELQAAGLSIPSDIAFASFDDSPWFDVLTPPVTAIAQPVSEMGRAAVELVSAIIAGEETGSVTLPASLIIRDSSRAFVTEATP